MVYYRKYRPQKISDLDLLDVKEKLTAILSSKEIPHAFLFTGPRGLGKTSSARILSKAINCQTRDGIEPCNKCEICVSITEGSHIDIIEIDAASNRGVDEIRSLREKVKFSPSQLKKKVYIIDEVHMLTNEAFNALLKTLEEPPSHVIFILATTEVHKIPQTILSRAFGVKFEKPTISEITNSLRRIVKGEELQVDDEIFPKIYELAEGSFRDGAKILEELSLASLGNKIDLELLEKVYKTGSTYVQVEKLMDAIKKHDIDMGLEIISEMANEGADFKIVIEHLVEKLRQDLISGAKNIYETKKILSLLNEAYVGIKTAVIPQLPLELVVIELSLMDRADLEVKNEKSKEQKSKVEAKQEDVMQEKKPLTPKTAQVVEKSDFLKQLIEIVHKEDKRVAAFLRSCINGEVVGEDLILITPYLIHAKKLMEQDFKEIILKSVFDIDPKIRELVVRTS